eukprot:TRINITY_DN3148_c0_g1_i1.p2 TRINITY_DN3148_c0_g1~~TRINITY_DN3148_c0_g1_i1.p2  ORF type:complete len:115 (+),score=44.24 TRINITY_DN3148_c0_g1_i1:201-545(+)
MRLVILSLCFALAVVSAAPTPETPSESEFRSMFEQFKQEHSKEYTSDQEPSKYSVFKDNVNYIHHHNKHLAPQLGYTVKINQFADLTRSEFKRQYLGLNAVSYTHLTLPTIYSV